MASRAHLRFCTTHITPETTVIDGRPVNETQLDEVRAGWSRSTPPATPSWSRATSTRSRTTDASNTWYSPAVATAHNAANTGDYRELDDTDPRLPRVRRDDDPRHRWGRCGQSAKIDLVFVRANRVVGPYSADSLPIPSCGATPCSDHRALVGTVRVSVG